MMPVFKAFAIVIALSVSVGYAVYCPNTCRFTFCPAVYIPFAFGNSDVPLTTAICDGTGAVYVGDVDSTKEALVYTPYGYVPISSYSPAGLTQSFSASFWKSYSFPVYNSGRTLYYSGVGHEAPIKNQANFVRGVCYVLPLKEYQVLNAPYGNVTGNVYPTNPLVDCVGFSVY